MSRPEQQRGIEPGGYGEPRPHYWCAADKPDILGPDFAVGAVCRTTPVPEDASCETCGISIRELQAELGK